MNPQVENTTAVLAAAFAGMLFGADALTKAKEVLDPRTAKELAVISRVLEKRLSDTRKTLSQVAAANAVAPVPAESKPL